MILDRLLYVSHQVTQLMPGARSDGDRNDTCTILTFDGRRSKSLLNMSQLREAHSLTLWGVDDHVLQIL